MSVEECVVAVVQAKLGPEALDQTKEVAEDLVENAGADVNELRAGYGTALHVAVARNHESVAGYLISTGTKVDVQPYAGGCTPLDIAVSSQHHGTIKLLLANGASPLTISKYGLSIAAELTVVAGSDLEEPGFLSNGLSFYTILACATMLPDKDIFYMMLATLVDIASPEAILLAAADQRIIDSGDVCRAMLLDRLDDETLGSEKVLTESLLPVLFSVRNVGRRALRLLKQQNRLELLISNAILQFTINMPIVEELLVEYLAEAEKPCASITQDVLEIVAEYYGPDTLRAFIQSSPRDSCTIKDLILPAVVSRVHRYTAPRVVLEFAGADIAADEELQRKLLQVRSGLVGSETAIVPVFLTMPRLMAPVKKMLIRIVLRCYQHLDLEHNEVLLLRVLEHSDDQDVVDDELLALAAGQADAKAVKMLLDRSYGLSMVGEQCMKAAADNRWKGKEVIQFLLDEYGAEATITSNVVRIAAGRYNGVFEFLLETRPEQVPITADIVGQIVDEESLKLVLRHKREEMAQIAPQVLRVVVDPREYYWGAMEQLLEHCPLSWFEPTESLILDVLEGGGRETVRQISLLINKFGDKVVITEPILAAAAASQEGGEVPDIFRIWKPEQFRVTAWIVEKTAACGSPHGLDYLIRASGGALAIEDKWYRLALFRCLVADCDDTDFREEWDDDNLDFNMADAFGKTALHVAAAEGKLALVRFLLEEARADVLATDRRGWTALHFAAHRGDIELVQTLLAAAADPYQAGLEGETPVSIATEKSAMGYEEVHLETLLWILKDGWYSRFMTPEFGMDDDEDEKLE